MQKKALTVNAYVVAAGAFGAFFRWLQNQTAFETDTGLLKPGVINYIVPLVIVAALYLFYRIVKGIKAQRLTPPDNVWHAFRAKHIAYPAVYYGTALITVVGGFVTLLTARDFIGAGFFRFVALLALVCGVSFPMICSASKKKYSPSMVSTIMTLPIIMCCVWLIGSYKVNASTPTVWAFAVEIIALCILTISFYYAAGFAFGKAMPHRAMFFNMAGAFMCIMTLADTRLFGLQLVLVGSAAMLITENWLLVCNLQEMVEEEPQESGDEKEPESDELVVKAGEDRFISEPTIEAPEYKPDKEKALDDIMSEFGKEE